LIAAGVALRNALDVRVYREGRAVEAEEEHDACRLVAHAGQAGEQRHGLVKGHGGKVIQRIAATRALELFQGAHNVRRLLVVHAGGADGVDNGLQGHGADGIPVAFRQRLELIEGAAAVGVVGVGAEDGAQEHLEWLFAGLEEGRAIVCDKRGVDGFGMAPLLIRTERGG
jgi:hypothetical protein